MAAATSAAIAVRAARGDDAVALADLSSQLGYPIAAADMRERLARVHAAGAGEVFVATDAQDRAVGWTHVVPRLQLEEAPCAELAGLVVDASARGADIGARLLAAAEEWARSQGFGVMRVRSNVLRERAHGFYERGGYERIKSQAVFRKALAQGR